jgi:hypothetical protein
MDMIGIDVIGPLPNFQNSSLDQNESLRGFHNGQYIHEPISQQLSQLVGLEVGTLPSNE